MTGALAIAIMPLAACTDHGSVEHRICRQCRRTCMEGRYVTATRCFDCASQRTGEREAFRSAYHRIKAFVADEKGGVIS